MAAATMIKFSPAHLPKIVLLLLLLVCFLSINTLTANASYVSDPTLFYNFSQDSGTQITDLSGNNNHGILTQPVVNTPIDLNNGYWSRTFYGPDHDYITIPKTASTNLTGDYVIEVYRTPTNTIGGDIVGNYKFATKSGWLIQQTDDRYLFYLGYGTSYDFLYSAHGVITPGTPVHLIVTVKSNGPTSSIITMYINGEQNAYSVTSHTPIYNNVNDVIAGLSYGSTYDNGTYYLVREYNNRGFT
jgi:hypothetical protein